jgi:hypothetical protein
VKKDENKLKCEESAHVSHLSQQQIRNLHIAPQDVVSSKPHQQQQHNNEEELMETHSFLIPNMKNTNLNPFTQSHVHHPSSNPEFNIQNHS